MKKYRYNGSYDVHLAMIGNVKVGQTINSRVPINHPDFEEVKDQQETQRQPEVVNK